MASVLIGGTAHGQLAGDETITTTAEAVQASVLAPIFDVGGITFTADEGSWSVEERNGRKEIVSRIPPSTHLQLKLILDVMGPGRLAFNFEESGNSYLTIDYPDQFDIGAIKTGYHEILLQNSVGSTYFTHTGGSTQEQVVRLWDVRFEPGWVARVVESGSGSVVQDVPGEIFPSGTKVKFTAIPPQGASLWGWEVNGHRRSGEGSDTYAWNGASHVELIPRYSQQWATGPVTINSSGTYLWTRGPNGGFVHPPVVRSPRSELRIGGNTDVRIRIEAVEIDPSRAPSALTVSFGPTLIAGQSADIYLTKFGNSPQIASKPATAESTDISNIEAVLRYFFPVEIVSPGGVVLEGVDEEGYAEYGSQVRYKLEDIPGSRFKEWSGDLMGQGMEGSITVDGPITASASFDSWTSSDYNYRRWTYRSFEGDGAYLHEVSSAFSNPDKDYWSNYMEFILDLDPETPDGQLKVELLPPSERYPRGQILLRSSAYFFIGNVHIQYATSLEGPWTTVYGVGSNMDWQNEPKWLYSFEYPGEVSPSEPLYLRLLPTEIPTEAPLAP